MGEGTDNLIDESDDLTRIQGVYSWGLQPDPSLTVDEWADRYMVIAKSTGANEAGPYRTSRTPYAREVMRCLSHTHPCSTVVAKVGSQMFKTQVALNFICSIIHQTPANILLIMPTGKLHKRIADRIDKTFAEVPTVRDLVAPPRSRDSKNTQDIKHFRNGSLYIATAGAAANLAEIAARFFLFDEIDRAPRDVNNEGDAVKLGENRTSTFSYNRKMYYYSSPTLEDESRIQELYENGTQREPLAECVHCSHPQILDFNKLIDIEVDDGTDAVYPCQNCGALLYESDKPRMFAKGEWTDAIGLQRDVESFTASAMYAPYGWVSWKQLRKDYKEAQHALDGGDDELMKVFYNTRLALTWARRKIVTSYDSIQDRAEEYKLGTVPAGGIVLTAAVDVQEDRLEYAAYAWGFELECWHVDYKVFAGDPNDSKVWDDLLKTVRAGYKHEHGKTLKPGACFVDSGGHHTQVVYNFARKYKRDKFYAIKGSSTPDAPVIAARPSKPEVTSNGRKLKRGVELWHIGTNACKDMLAGRWNKEEGHGVIHFSNELHETWFKGLVSEFRESKKHRGRKITQWVQRKHSPNEPLDLTVYNLAAAYKLNLHLNNELWWAREAERLAPQEPEGYKSKKQEIPPEIKAEDYEEKRPPVKRKPQRKKSFRHRLNSW